MFDVRCFCRWAQDFGLWTLDSVQRLDRHRNEAQVRMSQCSEGSMAQINDASIADQSFRRSTIRYSHQNAAGRLRIERHQDFRAQWIEPRGRGVVIGIKPPSIG